MRVTKSDYDEKQTTLDFPVFYTYTRYRRGLGLGLAVVGGQVCFFFSFSPSFLFSLSLYHFIFLLRGYEGRGFSA